MSRNPELFPGDRKLRYSRRARLAVKIRRELSAALLEIQETE